MSRQDTVRYTGKLINEVNKRNRAGKRLIKQIDRERNRSRRR